MNDLKKCLLIALVFVLPNDALAADSRGRVVEATSFAGKPLYRYEIPVDKRADVYEQIATLEAASPKSEDAYIRLGYLYIEVGRFQDAIDVYTRGLSEYPDSFKLLRHRGHRYINVRELDKAIVDLERAVELIGDEHRDVIQYRLNGAAFGTYEHWVWYHIALYHYLNGSYERAAAGYERCVKTAMADTMLVGAVDWLWNAYRKAGNEKAAAAALSYVPDDVDVPPQYAYYRRVMLYKGQGDPKELVDVDKDSWNGLDITLGYGVANWYLTQGDEATAQKIFDKILEAGVWNAWAYVATDREQAAKSNTPR